MCHSTTRRDGCFTGRAAGEENKRWYKVVWPSETQHPLFPPGTCSPPKVTDPFHSPFPLNRLPPPPWTERPGGVRSARHLLIPGRFRVVDSPPTSLFLDSPGIQVASLGLWAPGSSPHPLIIPRTLAEPVPRSPTPHRAPSPARSFGVGLKFKIKFKSALAGLRPCVQLPSLRALVELEDPLGQRAWTLLDPTSSPQEPGSGEQPRLDRARSLEPQRAARYTSKEQGNAGDWDPSPGRPS